MEILDSFYDSKREKLFSLRHLALFFTTCLWIASIVEILGYFLEGYDLCIDNQLIIGLISIPVVYLSVFLRRRIWFYLFLVILLLFTFQKVEFFSYISLTFRFNSFEFNFLGFLFFILHVGLNTDYIQPKQRDQSTEYKIDQSKIQFFENQFSPKTKEQLEAINTKDLVEEAKIALKNVLDNKFENS